MHSHKLQNDRELIQVSGTWICLNLSCHSCYPENDWPLEDEWRINILQTNKKKSNSFSFCHCLFKSCWQLVEWQATLTHISFIHSLCLSSSPRCHGLTWLDKASIRPALSGWFMCSCCCHSHHCLGVSRAAGWASLTWILGCVIVIIYSLPSGWVVLPHDLRSPAVLLREYFTLGNVPEV